MGKPTFIAGVGASAGGLEALEHLFKNLPQVDGLALIVVQHLSPDYKSMMAELLSKHTHLSIQTAVDKVEVESNNIYLIPPKMNMTIFHGKLYLSEIHHVPGNINLPIDTFFRSLADDYQDKAIAIVLSGTGSDGTRGIRAIKETGGLVIVQKETSAKFDGMPRSAIATGLVDFIVDTEEIGDVLSRFISHPALVLKQKDLLDPKEEDYIFRILVEVKKNTGVDFTSYKRSTVSRRILRRLSVHQIENLENYLKYLEINPKESDTLYRELLIGVTSFFRDSPAFLALKEKVLPGLFASKDRGDQIRVWIAGCSTGEEAYSIAILLKEYIRENQLYNEVKVFATDIDSYALKTAGAGMYPDSILADIPEDRLRNYFIKRGRYYQVTPDIRECVIFAQHNITKDPPFSKIDLISCRNLLIYLQTEAQKKILSTFHFALNTNGFLFLGSSESLGDLSIFFEEVDPQWKIFHYKVGNLPFLAQNVSTEIPMKSILHKSPGFYNLPQAFQDDKTLEKLFSRILEEYLPPCVVVNPALQVVHVIGDVNEYLKIKPGKIKFDILQLVENQIKIALSSALRKCFEENLEIRYSNLTLDESTPPKNIDLILRPITFQKTQSNYCIIIFDSHSGPKPMSSEVIEYKHDENRDRKLVELEQELEFTRENLQSSIEQLETSNEELQATNEELLAANEELQSTNEELQSVNEELITLNSEHQSKINELSELYNDMNNLLSSTEIGTIFLDRDMRIRKFTPACQKIINLMAADKGRPISHISHRFPTDVLLQKYAEEVLDTLIPIERNVRTITEDHKSYLIKFLPYRTLENHIQGVVITFVDITELKKAEEVAKKKEEDILASLSTRAEILDNVPDAVIACDINFKIISWNRSAQLIFGYSEEEVLQRDFFALLKPFLNEEERKANKENIIKNEHITGHSQAKSKWGNLINVYLIKDVLFDKMGKPEKIVTIMKKL